MTGPSKISSQWSGVRSNVRRSDLGFSIFGLIKNQKSKIKNGASRSAFTLIEIMIVVGIMGIVLTMGIPMVYKVFHRAPMGQAIRDVEGVCGTARARAILQGKKVEVVFHPRTGQFEIAGGGGSPGGSSTVGAPGASVAGLSSAQLSPQHIMIEMLDVNLTEYRDREEATVRFFSDGTCDELTLVLHDDHSEWKKIFTETTTGLVNVENMR